MYSQLRMIQSAAPKETRLHEVGNPKGYTKLYNFHKYWGKKPREPIVYAIESLTNRGDVIVDPFIGFGTVARETVLRDRRCIGFDINPIAIELTKLLLSPPKHSTVLDAFVTIREAVQKDIESTYQLEDGRTATHYLWNDTTLEQVWIRGHRRRPREELQPSSHDINLIQRYSAYQVTNTRQPRFFHNSRINARPDLQFSDLMTGRAQRNLEKLKTAIEGLPDPAKTPMLLCLTSAVGQMTKMVFAITRRGKTSGKPPSKMEVGSWVIGYWRPKLHFEVNVWNCFANRVSRLLRSTKDGDALENLRIAESIATFNAGMSPCYVGCEPCQTGLKRIANNSVNLVLMDPPHSDRIPYLELSELWNSILNRDVAFDEEIVISNARGRGKTTDAYNTAMTHMLIDLSLTLREDAFLLLFYNARRDSAWDFISQLHQELNDLIYLGCFPSKYSAGSVVQDTRPGGLKEDLVLVYAKQSYDPERLCRLASLPGWSTAPPR